MMLDSLLIGFVTAVITWAQPYAVEHGLKLSVEQTTCLTEAEYFESRGEGNEGIVAVAYTALNRTKTRHISICDAIHEHSQFSYYNPHHKRPIREVNEWITSTFIAVYAQLGLLKNPINNATMYNSTKMSSWLDDAYYTTRINHHFFYQEKKVQTDQPLYPTQSAALRASRLTIGCMIAEPRCDPLYQKGGLVLGDRLLSLISKDNSTPTEDTNVSHRKYKSVKLKNESPHNHKRIRHT